MTDGAPAAAAPAAPAFASWRRWFWPTAIAVLALDHATKWWIFALPDSAALPSWISREWNRGVAWSIGHDHPLLVAMATVVLIPVLAWVWWWYFRPAGAWENLAFGAILGGAVGNAFDRACSCFGWFGFRGVRDFINVDLGFPPLNPWPTFNIADSGISCGFLVLVALSFRKPRTVAAPGAAAVTER